jgi:peptidoglycan/LPS O-acetylase OafA/YrhL
VSNEQREQITFVHALRGAAPLLVLWAHLGGWWLSVDQRTSVLQDWWILIVCRPLRLYQDGGHLGVLIFFLVSGFIITHVSMRETRIEFLIKRTFRLLPTMMVALAILPLLSYLSSRLNLPKVMGNNSTAYLSGLLLLNYFTGQPQVLTVLWTLHVEIAFYALTFLVINFSRTRPLLATWLMLISVLAGDMAAQVFSHLGPLMWNAMYVPFLLVGRCIYLGWSERVTIFQATISGLACYGAFLLVYTNISPGRLLNPGAEPVISHIIAILVFLALCTSGIRRVSKPLAFCADISYALYLMHAPLGGFMLFYLTRNGFAYEAALPITIIVLLCVSYCVFRLVEQPSQRYGRTLNRYLRTIVSRPEAKSLMDGRNA